MHAYTLIQIFMEHIQITIDNTLFYLKILNLFILECLNKNMWAVTELPLIHFVYFENFNQFYLWVIRYKHNYMGHIQTSK